MESAYGTLAIGALWNSKIGIQSPLTPNHRINDVISICAAAAGRGHECAAVPITGQIGTQGHGNQRASEQRVRAELPRVLVSARPGGHGKIEVSMQFGRCNKANGAIGVNTG